MSLRRLIVTTTRCAIYSINTYRWCQNEYVIARQRPGSIDSNCRAAKRHTRQLERRYRRLRDPAAEEEWRAQFKLQRDHFQSTYTNFWTARLNSCGGNARRLWRIIGDMMNPPTQSVRRDFTADDFAAHFRNKIDKIRAATASAPPPLIQSRSATSSLYTFAPVTESDILSIIRSSPTKSCLLDPIPTWLLKKLAPQLAPTICRLSNMSLASGVFPTSLKQAVVYPHLKKPGLDSSDLNSYRPISNLSFLSKVVERVVVKQFIAYGDKCSLFPSRQSAYRHFHSTETAVLSVHNDLVRSIDYGQVSALILLDLSSAFDTVDHDILLSILHNRFSIDYTALNWFRSYLSNRSQSFIYGGKQTTTYPVTCSVPQGSVLGPVEFICYTEDVTCLFDRLHIPFQLFADDTQAHVSVRPSDVSAGRQRLSACVADIADWCASRRLQLNAAKTEIMWFGSHANLQKIAGQNLTLTVGTDAIQPVPVVRDLGVLLDSELTLKQHIAKVSAACFFQLRRLRQLRQRLGQDVTTRLVLALITTRMDYCNSVLAGLPASTLAPLQRVQNAAARLIFQLKPTDHLTASFLQLHWLPVHFRILYKLCTIMYAIHHNQCPAYIAEIVTSTAHHSLRTGLRSSKSGLYTVPRLRTKFGERAFSYSGPAAWNSLPELIRCENNFPVFKKLLKTHFFCLAFNVT